MDVRLNKVVFIIVLIFILKVALTDQFRRTNNRQRSISSEQTKVMVEGEASDQPTP